MFPFNFLWTPLDNEVGHYRRYTRHELVSKLKNVGFQNIQIEYADSAGFFATLIFKLFFFINNKKLVSKPLQTLISIFFQSVEYSI